MALTANQLNKVISKFDFTTLEFHAGANPIFINKESGAIEAWADDTDVKVALSSHPSIIYIGHLTAGEAKAGYVPDLGHTTMIEHLELQTGEVY